jgi:thiamine biosynthesis lipoprotein
MVLRGKSSSGKPWQVGVIDPIAPVNQLMDESYYAAIAVTGRAVATSGDYRNVHEVNGRIVAHAIDPRTGRPIEHSLASVTVVAETCAKADALATAALVLGPEAGLQMLEEQDGVEGYLLSRVGTGEDVTLATSATSGMEAMLLPPIPEPAESR